MLWSFGVGPTMMCCKRREWDGALEIVNMAADRMHRYEIPAWDCYQLLEEHNVGRLAIIEHGYPLALPVSYRISGTHGPNAGRRIVFRTAPATTMGGYEGLASLEIDRIDEQEKAAWSVVARGTLHHLVGGEDEHPDPEPWLVDGRDRWMALDVVAVSGRRFVGRPASAGSTRVVWRFE
jgi:hypothetical protein